MTTGAKVDIEDDGSVFISAVDSAAAYAAKKMVDDICFVPEVGKLYFIIHKFLKPAIWWVNFLRPFLETAAQNFDLTNIS